MGLESYILDEGMQDEWNRISEKVFDEQGERKAARRSRGVTHGAARGAGGRTWRVDARRAGEARARREHAGQGRQRIASKGYPANLAW